MVDLEKCAGWNEILTATVWCDVSKRGAYSTMDNYRSLYAAYVLSPGQLGFRTKITWIQH